ncbi:MAG: DUF427 domain-containing protein [Saprospiraceae bacterium]
MKKIQPKPGQESVWDYPRPPKLERTNKHLRIIFDGIEIASTNQAYRVLETSHPPVYYLPQADIKMECLQAVKGRDSYCEWKGQAAYWNIITPNQTSPLAAWSYSDPTPRFAPIRDYLAFYASRVDECYVNDERVQAQSGDFYGGWITKEIVGPFKGGTGTWGW